MILHTYNCPHILTYLPKKKSPLIMVNKWLVSSYKYKYKYEFDVKEVPSIRSMRGDWIDREVGDGLTEGLHCQVDVVSFLKIKYENSRLALFRKGNNAVLIVSLVSWEERKVWSVRLDRRHEVYSKREVLIIETSLTRLYVCHRRWKIRRFFIGSQGKSEPSFSLGKYW